MPQARNAWLVILLPVILFGGGCHHPTESVDFNPYTRPGGRPWLKRAEDLIDAAEMQLDRLDSRMENWLY